MTAQQPEPPEQPQGRRHVRLGDLECPRCHQTFTASYWLDGVMIQARCLSCDLKWPLPSVV